MTPTLTQLHRSAQDARAWSHLLHAGRMYRTLRAVGVSHRNAMRRAGTWADRAITGRTDIAQRHVAAP